MILILLYLCSDEACSVHDILSQTRRLGSLLSLEKTWIQSLLRPQAGNYLSQVPSVVVSQVARHRHDCFQIGTSFSGRRSLNIFWTQCCFWHLSALNREGAAGIRLQADAAWDLLSWRVSGFSARSQLVPAPDCQQCLLGTSSLHHSSSVDKPLRPRHSKET